VEKFFLGFTLRRARALLADAVEFEREVRS